MVAIIFRASIRRLSSARSLRSPRAKIVTTMVVGFCDFHSIALLSDSCKMRLESRIVASSAYESPIVGGCFTLWMAYPKAAGSTARYARSNAPSWIGSGCPSGAVLRTSSREGLRIINVHAERIGHRMVLDAGRSKRNGDGNLS